MGGVPSQVARTTAQVARATVYAHWVGTTAAADENWRIGCNAFDFRYDFRLADTQEQACSGHVGSCNGRVGAPGHPPCDGAGEVNDVRPWTPVHSFLAVVLGRVGPPPASIAALDMV